MIIMTRTGESQMILGLNGKKKSYKSVDMLFKARSTEILDSLLMEKF